MSNSICSNEADPMLICLFSHAHGQSIGFDLCMIMLLHRDSCAREVLAFNHLFGHCVTCHGHEILSFHRFLLDIYLWATTLNHRFAKLFQLCFQPSNLSPLLIGQQGQASNRFHQLLFSIANRFFFNGSGFSIGRCMMILIHTVFT